MTWQVAAWGRLSEEQLLSRAASAERGSEHPVAAAIRAYGAGVLLSASTPPMAWASS